MLSSTSSVSSAQNVEDDKQLLESYLLYNDNMAHNEIKNITKVSSPKSQHLMNSSDWADILHNQGHFLASIESLIQDGDKVDHSQIETISPSMNERDTSNEVDLESESIVNLKIQVRK